VNKVSSELLEALTTLELNLTAHGLLQKIHGLKEDFTKPLMKRRKTQETRNSELTDPTQRKTRTSSSIPKTPRVLA
jgi:hypothetical protein